MGEFLFIKSVEGRVSTRTGGNTDGSVGKNRRGYEVDIALLLRRRTAGGGGVLNGNGYTGGGSGGWWCTD